MLALAVALTLLDVAPSTPFAPAPSAAHSDRKRTDALIPALNLGGAAVLLGTSMVATDFGVGRTSAAFGGALLGLGVGALLDLALFSPAALIDANDVLSPLVMVIPIAFTAPLAIGGMDALLGHGFGGAGALGAASLAVIAGIVLTLFENTLVDLPGAIPTAITGFILTGALATCAYAVTKAP